MENLHYLGVLAGCLLLTLPLEVALGARVYRRPLLLFGTLLPVVTVFAFWDVIASARGHWWWQDQFTLGVRVAGMPIEEWLFFLVVPICAVLTYEVTGRVRDRFRGRKRGRDELGRELGHELGQDELGRELGRQS